MTTPDNFNTPDRLIRMAYKDSGWLQEGEDPNSEMFADALNRLNDLINFEQTRGLKLWLQYDLTVPLVAGQGTYTLGPGGNINMDRPMRVLDSSYYLDANSNRRPIFLIARDDYNRLSNPTGQGAITQFFVQKNRTELSVTFWLIPDTTAAQGTAHLLVQQQVQNIVSVTDDMTLPIEWFLWARWALAADLASGQPQAIIARCQMYSEGYRDALENWDVEDAPTRFVPGSHMGLGGSSFR